MLAEFRSIQKRKEQLTMSTRAMDCVRPQLNSCINKINGRINCCRFQQHLNTVTRDEREGWWAEEAGLMDALARQGPDSIHESWAQVSAHALSLWSS